MREDLRHVVDRFTQGVGGSRPIGDESRNAAHRRE
jgi:hypothetical protein